MKTILLNPLLILLWIFPYSVQAQYITISGYVAHFFTGNPVENINVFESKSGIGTITDENGFFKLILKQGSFNISFARNGYKPITEQFSAKSDTTLKLTIEPVKWINEQVNTDDGFKAEEIKKASSQRKKILNQ